MTVISAMRFNKYEGAMVGDEQSSNFGSGRKDDLATKLIVLNRPEHKEALILGGSGAANVLHEVIERGRENPTLQGISNVMRQVRHELIDEGLMTQSRCTEEDIQRGYKIVRDASGKPVDRVEISSDIKAKYEKNMESMERGILGNQFLVVAYNRVTGISIYSVAMSTSRPFLNAQHYLSIGSGMDMADATLYDFFSRKPRTKRAAINPAEGLAALLLATDKASMRNIGVGGIPYVQMVKGAEGEEPRIISPSENNTLLAVEAIRGREAGFLTDDFVQKAVDELLYQNRNVEDVEKEMWEAATNKTSFSRMLRGYRIEQEGNSQSRA